jgi:hypothetical protein
LQLVELDGDGVADVLVFSSSRNSPRLLADSWSYLTELHTRTPTTLVGVGSLPTLKTSLVSLSQSLSALPHSVPRV